MERRSANWLPELVVREEARGLLRIVSSSVVELRCGWVGVADVALDVFEACAVLERRGDEGRAHRVRGEAFRKSESLLGVLPEHAVDHVRVHVPPLFLALSVAS